MLGTDTAAAADDLRPLLAPCERQPSVLPGVDLAFVAPAGRREVAEVGVDTERQVGEVAQPGDHARDVVGGDAVDQERGDAHLLEAPRRAAEGVPLGSSPVLAIDAADAVATPAEAEPDR